MLACSMLAAKSGRLACYAYRRPSGAAQRHVESARMQAPHRFTVFLVGILCITFPAAARCTGDAAHRFMSALCGTWVGVGTSKGTKVSDKAAISWSPDRTYLQVLYIATAGDDFRSEATLRHDPSTSIFTLFERSNSPWPQRTFTGTLRASTLRLTESTPTRVVRLTLTLASRSELQMQEQFVEAGKTLPPFVNIHFRKKGVCS